jgi:hypothetical protein
MKVARIDGAEGFTRAGLKAVAPLPWKLIEQSH